MQDKAVGIIDHIGTKGGHHYYSLCLLKALEKKKIKTFYFSNQESTEYSSTQCFKVFSKNLTRSFSGLLKLLPAIYKSIVISKRNKVKTQIFHTFEASVFNCAVLLVLRLSGFKTIVIIHDVNSFDIKEMLWVKKLQYNLLSNELVVHNEHCKKVFKEGFQRLKKPLHIIHHGGHLDVISPLDKSQAREKLGLTENRNYFLFFGQIKKPKGLDVLLEALPAQENVCLMIAGKPWRDDFSNYEKIIEDRGIQSNLHLTIRYIKDEEKDLYYSATDFVVLPYREIYQSGVLLMAMSYGKAVIASDIPANREVITEEENGLLFRNGDSEDLSRVLRKAMHLDPDRLGKNALETIRSKYDWNQIADSYLPLIK